jgi:KDO2-lipid IV(A) lauroyltransferase
MPRRQKKTSHPAHPRYWLTWLGAGLFVLLGQLPWPVLTWLGRLVGALAWWLVPARRHTALVNMTLCFPEKSESERRRMAFESVSAAGIGFMEMAGAYFGLFSRPEKRLEIQGREHLDQALGQGKGVLLMGMHFTTLEIAGRLLGSFCPYGAMYRPNDNPVLDWLILKGRSRFVADYIERGDIKRLVKKLRGGGVVWYAPDQDYGRRHSVYVPFFGHPAATITATAKIARLSGSPVIPISYFRLPGGGYRLVFDPPLQDFPSGDDVVDATRVNEAVENAVRRAPEQYLWVHRRFKHQPDNSKPYA